MKLPIEFETRMKQMLGEEYNSFLATFSDTPKKAFHVNQSMISSASFEACCDFPISPMEHIENGYYYSFERIGSHPLHHAGAIYSQDPAAMMPVSGLSINPDWKVLDLCAAPGGKTSQIASILSTGKGILLSNEINPSRNRILISNIERMGYRNVLVTKLQPDEIAMSYPGYFDCVLVDAPCSGEGMFRKYPDAVNEWSLEQVNVCATRQKEILNSAVRCLRPGGIMIYSTCTYSQEEDEDIVEYLQNTHHFEVLPVSEKILNHTVSYKTGCQRFYPHISCGEGQFMAYLQKPGMISSDSLVKPNLKEISKKNLDRFKQTLSDSITNNTFDLYEYQDRILALPKEFITLPPHGITMCGVFAGQIDKDRFIPYHQFFSAYGKEFNQVTNLDLQDPRLSQYLTGNEISGDSVQKGFGAILCAGCPIGGYKAVNGRYKNHYPKALRNYL